MRHVTLSVLAAFSFMQSLSQPLKAETNAEPTPATTPVVATPSDSKPQKFEPFTGKVVKNKVRLRLQPTFDGHVLKELHRDDMIVVLGETDDFYAVQPPQGTKAYIFRTYVLDNVVEGTRVNVRLKPDLESPIVAQLNSGDRVEGSIDANNNKWMEINLPPTTRFYVAKDYIEKIGDVGLMNRLEKRREEVSHLLNTTKSISDTELLKPFEKMNIDGIVANYQKIIHDYPEFPEVGARAKSLLSALQEAYNNKKIAYLEEQKIQAAKKLEEKNKKLAEELKAQKEKVTQLEKQIQKEKSTIASVEASRSPLPPMPPKPTKLPTNMSNWLPVEEALYRDWSMQNRGDQNAFYQSQKESAFILKGIVEVYNRPVKNRPGDYMLVNSASKLPVAFLYSTHVNLQDFVGHEVTILVSPRPNHNYAFPAYFVLSIE
jgi:uncharacterized protein YgiM (DUF1202 family)